MDEWERTQGLLKDIQATVGELFTSVLGNTDASKLINFSLFIGVCLLVVFVIVLEKRKKLKA